LSYTVLARRYRSTSFDTIVGQEPIARTLKNAIESDRTAHAYLFCGTRGVGKTSMARIFARELNRSDELQEENKIGDAVFRGNDLDVIEIDGASNRGVQEARDLIASAGLAPSRCKYRIFIIDEVHMLTTPAFNALLKTMEEPPSHVKFILCTTEPHKVPSTIQSRCQKFDFKAITTSKIIDHLKFILQEEKIKADDEVIAEVAMLGNGSMRDALSILDRLLAGGSTTIKLEEMEDLLGLPSQTAMYQLCTAVAHSKLQEAFLSSDVLISSGISLDRVLEVLAMSFRNALIGKVCGADTPMLELSDGAREIITTIGNQLNESQLTYMIALCDATSRQVRRGGTGRALFDATIARLCMSSSIAQAGNILCNNEPTARNKKKRITTNSSPSTKPVAVTPKQAEKPVTSIPSKEVNWESIRTCIAGTPGLKRIVTYLEFSKLEGQKLTLKISDDGTDSINYILAQRQRIEQILAQEFGGTFTVVIVSNQQTTSIQSDTDSFDAVKNDELVQTARGLFEGTIVQVTATPPEDT